MVLFASRRRAEDLEVEVTRLQAWLAELGAMDDMQRFERRQAAEQQLAWVLNEERAARDRVALAQQELAQLQALLVETRTEQLLQEAGIYEYAHPLESAVAYKDKLAALRTDIKAAVTGRRAVTGSVDWTVNGSRSQGAKMVKDFSTLMLRAYNAEADNCVRTVKPHTLRTVRQRLDKTQLAIAKLGRTMSIAITDRYHRLRLREIELTADYLAKVEAERELIRAQKEAAREEERARREFERQKEKLLKEQAHYRSAYDRLLAQARPDPAAVAELCSQLDRLGADIAAVEARAANTRAGYVYVISNLGSFGDHIVKIGMTRRLEPMDRVRELGDASVPFRFDVHALIFSDDAVGLETRLHTALADQRVNKINQHREFFRATPVEVRRLLAQVAGSHLLEFTETAEALEWRASGAEITLAPLPPEPAPVPAPPPAEDEDRDDLPPDRISPPTPSCSPRLHAGHLVPLPHVEHLRLLLHADNPNAEIDPIAFLLTDQGTVGSDTDMVFYGQPDHPSGAISLAADDTGASTALHVTLSAVPAQVTEILLTAQLSAGAQPTGPTRLHVLDINAGNALGELGLPTPGDTGLVQLGALHRRPEGWALQPQPAALDLDLASLATAAGVDIT
jgi:stress response protein SCP2